MYTSYGGECYRPTIDFLPDDKLSEVESMARMAISLSTYGAEPYVLLGDVYLKRGNLENAEKMYKNAISKKYGSDSSIQFAPYYTEIPADRLADICIEKRDFTKALLHNKMSLLYGGRLEPYIQKRLSIIKELGEETNVLCGRKE